MLAHVGGYFRAVLVAGQERALLQCDGDINDAEIEENIRLILIILLKSILTQYFFEVLPIQEEDIPYILYEICEFFYSYGVFFEGGV